MTPRPRSLRLQAVIDDYRPKIVVSLGDSFHDGEARRACPARSAAILSALMAGRDWFWVAGNHDPEPPAGLPGETVRGTRHRRPPVPARTVGRSAGGRNSRPPASLRPHRAARALGAPPLLRRRRRAHVMPAFGAYTGSLNVLDRAYAGLFRSDGLMAYMIGTSRIFAIAGGMLRPG